MCEDLKKTAGIIPEPTRIIPLNQLVATEVTTKNKNSLKTMKNSP